MKLLIYTAFLLLFAADQCSAAERDDKLIQTIEVILQEWQTLTPGSTRADLLKLFTIDGGIASRYQQVFVSRRCPYVKVRVQFKPGSGNAEDFMDMDDIVVAVSKPYLEHPRAD